MDADIFCQEFYLHVYSLFAEDRNNFMESKEGMTYVRLRHHDKVIGLILPQIRGPLGDLQKWNLKVRRLVKRLKNLKGVEADYIDFDLLLGMIVEDYKKQRKQYQSDLQRAFKNLIQNELEPIDLDQFIDVINTGLPHYNEHTVSDFPLVQFP